MNMMKVLGHDGDTLGMNSSHLTLLKKLHCVSLYCLMNCSKSIPCPPEWFFRYGLSNFPNQPRQRKFRNKEISTHLQFPNLSQCSFTWFQGPSLSSGVGLRISPSSSPLSSYDRNTCIAWPLSFSCSCSSVIYSPRSAVLLGCFAFSTPVC